METNRSKNLILILLFVLLILNVSMMLTFFMFPKKNVKDIRFERKIRMKERTECLMNDLKLNEVQEKDFFALRDEHKSTIKDMFNEVRAARNSMINSIALEPVLSAEELYVHAENIGKLETDIQKETIDYFLKMRTILNPEQFDKLLNNFRDVCGCQKMSKDKHYHKRKSGNRDSCFQNDNNHNQ